MRSSKARLRIVEARTPPFRALVKIRADLQDNLWAQAKAESILMEQIKEQLDGGYVGLPILKKAGVYTVRYDEELKIYVHEVDAPDGITFQAVEEMPLWWEAKDTVPMDRIPNGTALTIALLPTLSLDAWRKNSWPDRPHP